MNVAIVCKQSTTTSERMSTSIHRSKLSTFNSINFDNSNRKNCNIKSNINSQNNNNNNNSNNNSDSTSGNGIRGQQHHQQERQQQQQLKRQQQSARPAFNKPNRKTILMESNAVWNGVQKYDNDHRRRHSFGVRDEQLLKILSAPPDEPLYINDTANNKATINSNSNSDNNSNSNSNSGDNLLMQYEAATSSIVAVDENLPPATDNATTTTMMMTTAAAVVANIEDGNLGTMSSTPQKGFSVATWNIIQRDLDSPSASCRLRALRAIKSPTNCNYYSHFGDANDENSISSTERTAFEAPRTIQEVMKDVIVYVEVRSGQDFNRTSGIKGYIANLGAKVNERLLRNTTHVVFKDGLQSTYTKAKSWNIPIVSILWIEACKKHLILMDPKEYPIANIEKYENPDLYGKAKRQKFIQPDTLMKNLHRPIPKSKILETLKKRDDDSLVPISSSSSLANATVKHQVDSTANVSHTSPWARKTTASILSTTTTSAKPKATTQGRKSLAKKPVEQPKNTIRSMFEKQLEKSRTESSQQLNGTLSGTLDEMATLNINDTVVAANELQTQTPNGKSKSAVNQNGSKEGEVCIMTGSLHKRLTRRNSFLMQTPTKSILKTDAGPSSAQNSAKKRRCTMFAPSFKDSIDEENISDCSMAAAANDNKNDTVSAINKNRTVNKTIAMELCNQSKTEPDTTTNKCNSKVRQLLNTELSVKVAHDRSGSMNGTAATATATVKVVHPKSNLRRRTTYTPQVMEETKVQISSITPTQTKQRRKTINANANSNANFITDSRTINTPELIETKSCDAILTPTNNVTKLGAELFSTPLVRSLSKAHAEHIRSSTSKTLLDEYNDTFNSKKTPMTDHRRSLANIHMDIIKQRVENINRNASFNQSQHDLLEDSFHSVKSTPLPPGAGPAEKDDEKSATPVQNGNKETVNGQAKPMKRKLFAPPSLFPEMNDSSFASTTLFHNKTDKKTVASKRKRNEVPASEKLSKSDEKKTSTAKPKPSRKTINPRRSTLFFEEAPIRKINQHTNTATTNSTTSTLTPADILSNGSSAIGGGGGLAFTSLHQSQKDFITEAVKKLGKFKLEDKVNQCTTHLVTLDNRRTINLLRGLIRGVWILQYDWVVKSVEANHWLSETDYEMRSFSKAVEVNRIERQAFGRKYRMDIFRNFDNFYLSSKCACKNLKELIVLCYGKVTPNVSQARYFITETHRSDIDSKNHPNWIQLHPNWILDSITAGKVEKFRNYIVAQQTQNQI